MAKSENSKLKCLMILKILCKYSNSDHPLNATKINDYLSEFNLESERKSIYRDIEVLKNAGFNIESTREGFYAGDLLFELPELKLLVDAVQSSSFITAKKTKEIVQKLTTLTNDYDALQLNRQLFLSKKKTENEKIFYLVDKLQQAISQNKPVTFKYFDYTIRKEKKYRRNSSRYHLLPYALLWENQQYYCIGYSEKYQNFSHYRVDRMDDIEVLNDPQDKIDLDLDEYTSKVFGMFTGQDETVTLSVDQSLANVIFDTFSKDVLISQSDEKSFTIHVKVSISEPFIAWIMQFQGKIKVLSPLSLIEKIKKQAQDLLSQYS